MGHAWNLVFHLMEVSRRCLHGFSSKRIPCVLASTRVHIREHWNRYGQWRGCADLRSRHSHVGEPAYQRVLMHVDILEIFNTHMETGRLATWGFSQQLYFHSRCCPHTHVTELPATNTSDLMSGDRRKHSQSRGNHHPRGTHHPRSHQGMAAHATLFEI